MAAIEIEDLVVVRGGRTVLAGLTVMVARGAITGLLGPSGSGKTTLMRCVVGVQVVRSGGVRVLGEAAGSAALRSRVGYVTQAPSVYSDLTVLENARYFVSLQGAGRRQAAQVVKDVGLAGQEDQLVASLSGGQHSRVSLACALVGAPEVLVLDEPTVGADPILREELWARFRELTQFARTEFQALQFMPLVVTPQVLLCGLFVARDEMVGWLEGVSNVLPLTYAVEALQEVGAHTQATGMMWRDLGVVLAGVVVALVLAAVTLPRRTP